MTEAGSRMKITTHESEKVSLYSIEYNLKQNGFKVNPFKPRIDMSQLHSKGHFCFDTLRLTVATQQTFSKLNRLICSILIDCHAGEEETSTLVLSRCYKYICSNKLGVPASPQGLQQNNNIKLRSFFVMEILY